MIKFLIRNGHPLRTVFVVFALLISAAFLRLPALGDLGFYGDEETTAFVARSVAEGDGLKMPSGLEYYRSVPMTLLNAFSASLIGTEEELSYRIPSAILGVITPVFLFILARTLVPTGVALSAAILLVFSEWHVITSREARMYVPFMLCFMGSGLVIWRWAAELDLRKSAIITLAVCLTLAVHSLGLLLLLFPVVWLSLQVKRDVPWKHLTAIVVLVTAFYFLVNKLIIMRAYVAFKESFGTQIDQISAGGGLQTSASLSQLGIQAAPWLVGGLIGGWLGWRVISVGKNGSGWTNNAAVLVTCAIFGSATIALQFYGAGLAATSVLLLYRGSLRKMLNAAFLPSSALLGVAAAHLLLSHDMPISMPELKDHLLFPYPYFLYFWQYTPGILVLFWLGIAILVFDQSSRTTDNIKASALATIGIFAAVGTAMKWGGMRYLIGAYPFMLLVASYPLYRIYELGEKRGWMSRTGAFLVVGALIFTGILGGHGINAAMNARDISYGDSTSKLALGYSIYPDHKHAGEYVRRHLGGDDTVVAADALQQYWYVGRVSYWLNNPVSSSGFAYKDRQGSLRDIYVSSQLLFSPKNSTLCSTVDSTIWIITSAEKIDLLNRNLSQEQYDWLTGIESQYEPVFKGRDGETMVYALPCNNL